MLPVEAVLSQLTKALVAGDAILIAPPGAGKSTCLPLHLLKSDQFQGSKIVMLQPRRIAVRNIARYLSAQLGETVGQSIGYRIRGETKVSHQTRLEIVTEGVLVRMLQAQPELSDVSLVIFDEFHERSIHADFSLALCLEVQQALRDDLRLLVMSATLDVGNIQELLPDAEILESKGRQYSVDIVYCADAYRASTSSKHLRLHDSISKLIFNVFPKHSGDILVFLPGAFEINAVANALENHVDFQSSVAVHKLFSELSPNIQQAALLPDKLGRRKVVLATNIAETSLTIEGVDVVIDSGVEKIAVFQLNRGITHLQTQAISQASATQRAGRAGRLRAGTCYRLWNKEFHARLAKHGEPEIKRVDVSNVMLESAVWGTEVSGLSLLDYPSNAQLAESSVRLQRIGIFDQHNKLTTLGHHVHQIGGQANLAIMLLRAKTWSQAHLSLACALVGLLENKDPMGQHVGADIHLRVQQLQNSRLDTRDYSVLRKSIQQWHIKMSCKLSDDNADWPVNDIGVLLGFAFPEWLAKQRQNERYLLAKGSGAVVHRDDPLTTHTWLAIANMQSSDRQQENAQIRYAAAISEKQILEHFEQVIVSEDLCSWDENEKRIVGRQQRKLGKVIVSSQPLAKPDTQVIENIWQAVIVSKGISALPMSARAQQLIQRVALANTFDQGKALDLPHFDKRSLLDSIDIWLLPFIKGKLKWAELTKVDFYQALSNLLDWQQQQWLNKFCPERIVIPSGRQQDLTYSDDSSVVLSVRMGELYGWSVHPAIADNQVAITIELLSPAQRPIQITKDLVGFWAGSYRAVQKDMKSQYPKHYWPDNPANAPATTKTKRNMKPV